VLILAAAAVLAARSRRSGPGGFDAGTGGLVRALGGALVGGGALLFAGNMLGTVIRHGGVEMVRRSAVDSEASDTPER